MRSPEKVFEKVAVRPLGKIAVKNTTGETDFFELKGLLSDHWSACLAHKINTR